MADELREAFAAGWFAHMASQGLVPIAKRAVLEQCFTDWVSMREAPAGGTGASQQDGEETAGAAGHRHGQDRSTE